MQVNDKYTDSSCYHILVAALTATSLPGFELNHVYVEEGIQGYTMAEDLTAVLTFTFRDGIELNFLSFQLHQTLSHDGTFFEVKGVVGNGLAYHNCEIDD